MKDKSEASACLPGIAEAVDLDKDTETSRNIKVARENTRLKARVAELEEELQTVFINVTETFEAVAIALKDQAILRGRELSEFMDPAREAVKEGDSIRVLAYTRQGVAKLKKALQDSPVPALKSIASPEKPRLVAASKIELRALEIKERIEESGLKTFSSRDARQYIAGVEGEEPSRRDTIRALKQTVKMLPQFALEVVGGISRLICRDCRPEVERHYDDEMRAEEQKRSLWQRQGLTVALPWLDPNALRGNSGGA